MANSDTSVKPVADFVLVVVYSNWDLSKIYDYIFTCSGCTEADIGPMKIEYQRNSNGERVETNRTLCLMRQTAWQAVLKYGQTNRLEVRMNEYQIRDYNYPRTGESPKLFFPLPDSWTMSEATEVLKAQLEQFVLYGFIASGDYRIDVPSKTRRVATTEHRGNGFVIFRRSVTLESIIIMRLLLNDSVSGGVYLSCYWARRQKRVRRYPNMKNGDNKETTEATEATKAGEESAVEADSEEV